MSGIYIHIPFCKQACHYCNFHFSTTLKYKSELISCIGNEIVLTRGFLQTKHLSSIYFGGGTPSLLSKDELLTIFSTLKDIYHWDENTEITLEANPDDINEASLELWKQIGVNRLSIGVQSFFDEDLKWMNRVHSASEAESSVIMAKDLGFENITVDLIYGCPSTTDKMWKENINRVVSLGIPHISSYCLTVEQGTALAYFVAKGKSPDVDQDKAIRQFDTLIDQLEVHGYEHYEISNFAKDRKYSFHNSSYWKGSPYLGVGPGAHSYNRSVRRWNIANNMKYLKSIKKHQLPYQEELLSIEDKYNEYIITRLRTKWGINEEVIDKKFIEHFNEKISLCIKDEYIVKYDKSYVLTRKGKHFADRVSMKLMVSKKDSN